MQTTLPEKSGISQADLESSLLSALDRLGKPMSVSKLRPQLSKPFQRSAKELTSVLERLVIDHRAFKVGSAKTPAYTHRDPTVVAERVILSRLEQGPASEKALSESLKSELPGYAAKPLLSRLLAEQRIHPRYKLSKTGKASKTIEGYVFGPPPPLPSARELILKALEPGPLKLNELKERVSAQIPNLEAAEYEAALGELVKSQAVHAHRAFKEGIPQGSPSRYALTPEPPPDPRAFIKKLSAPFKLSVSAAGAHKLSPAAVVAALLEEAGLDRIAIATELTGQTGPGRRTGSAHLGNDREALLTMLKSLVEREGSGALIPISRLRASLDLDPARFNTTVLSLAASGEVNLHHHDLPGALSDKERAELVVDSHGTYYVGIALGRSA